MSDDEYSSLSDIDSAPSVDDDEDYAVPVKSRRGKKADKGGGYVIKDALKAPRATTYTAQALFDQIVSGDIDLDPEYQRDVVWPEAKQVGLIDSIFRNFYIPPVIFSVNAHDDGSENKICIDGKQRLTSIYRFMLGLIHHRDRATGERYWYKGSATPETGKKKKRNILPDKYRRLFANKQVVCVEYSDINDNDEREIFQRVQLGMALTPAEKLAVVKTPRADFIRTLQSKFFKDDDRGLGSLDWDRSRGTDFRCLATILWCIDRYTLHPRNFANTGSVTQLEAFLVDPAPVDHAWRRRVLRTFDVFQGMVAHADPAIAGVFRMAASEFNTGTSSRTKVSPIEFICITLLVFVWHEQLGVPAMANAIRDMRREVRREHVDIRLNTKVGKTMITFLKAIKVEDYQVDGDQGPANASTSPTTAMGKSTPTSTTTPAAKAGTKRKRTQDDTAAADENANANAMDTSADTPLPKSKSTKTRKGTSASASASASASTPGSPALPPPPSTSGSATPKSGAAVTKPKLASLRAVKQQHQAQVLSQVLTQNAAVDVDEEGQTQLPSPD